MESALGIKFSAIVFLISYEKNVMELVRRVHDRNLKC